MEENTPKKHGLKSITRIALIGAATLLCVAAIIALIALLRTDGEEGRIAEATPTIAPPNTPFVPDGGFEEILETIKGSTWQDRYDPNYTLRFDDLPSNAVEANAFTGGERVFSLSAVDGGLYLAEGQSRYMFWLSEGVLYLDFGGTVGIVEYLLVASEGS